MAGDFDGWEKNADGTIKVNPLVGWETGTAFGMAVIAQVHFSRSEGELRRGIAHKLPMGMTPAQAREFAQDLLRKADLAEQRAGSDGSLRN